MIRFAVPLITLAIISSVLTTNASGQPFLNPPQLQVVVNDDFRIDSRSKYIFSPGLPEWKPGQITIEGDCRLTLDTESGPWLEVDFTSVGLADTVNGPLLDVILNFSVAKNCKIALSYGDGAVVVAVHQDFGVGQKTKWKEIFSKEFECESVDELTWKIKYRQGLLTIESNVGIEQYFLLQDTHNAVVDSLSIEAKGDPVRLTKFVVRADSRAAEYRTKEILQKGKKVELLLGQADSLIANEDYLQAEEVTKEASQIIKKNLGRYHSDYISTRSPLIVAMNATKNYEPLLAELRSIAKIKSQIYGEAHIAYAKSLEDLGAVYSFVGEYEEASESYCLAKAIFLVIPGYELDYIEAGLAHSNMLRQGRNLKDSKASLLEIRRLFPRSLKSDKTLFANYCNNLGYLCVELSEFDEAKSMLFETLDLYENELGCNSIRYAFTLNNLGSLHADLWSYELAEELHTQSLCVSNLLAGEADMVNFNCMNNLARCYLERHRYHDATRLYSEVMSLLEQNLSKNHPLYALTLLNVARAHRRMGNYDKAEPLVRQVFDLLEKTTQDSDPRAYELCLSELSEIYRELGAAEESLKINLRTMVISEKLYGNTSLPYADSLRFLSASYRRLGQLDKAAELTSEYAQIIEEFHEHLGISRLFNADITLAQICLDRHEYEKVASTLLPYLDAAPIALGKWHRSMLLNLLGFAKIGLGHFEDAESLFSEVRKVRENLLGPLHPLALHSLRNEALCKLVNGNLRESEALELFKRMNTNFKQFAPVLTEREQAGLVSQKNRDASYLLSLACSQEKIGLDAIAMLLERKGAVLKMQAYSNYSQSAETLREEKGRLASILSRHLNAPPDTARWFYRRNEIERQFQALSKRIVIHPKGRPFDVHDFLDSLPVESAFIDFVEFDQPSENAVGKIQIQTCLAALTIYKPSGDPPVVRVVDLGLAKDIHKVVDSWLVPIERANELRRPIDSLGQNKMRLAGSKLKKLIWEPIAEHVSSAKLVIISPDGALCRFPLAALPGSDNSRYLIEERKLVFCSVPSLLHTTISKPTERINTECKILLCGDIDYGKSSANRFPPLIGAKQEIALIGKQFTNPTKLSHNLASETRFKELSSEHRIIHVASHSFVKSEPKSSDTEGSTVFDLEGGIAERPFDVLTDDFYSRSGIAFANSNLPGEDQVDDGILYSIETSHLALDDVDLVVLSSCDSGVGPTRNSGDGLISIQRAFEIAGAKSVISTFWKVDDEASRMLMGKFYENLIRYSSEAEKKGAAPNSTTVRLDALRDAQLWMLRGLSPMQAARLTRSGEGVDDEPAKPTPAQQATAVEAATHPRYWAAFSLSGDWR